MKSMYQNHNLQIQIYTMIFISRILACTILIFCLVSASSQGTSAPTWSGTTLIQAGVRIIVLNSAHQNGSNMYHYTYSPSFSASPLTALGIIGFQTTNVLQHYVNFWVNIADFTNTAVMKINMTAPSLTSWKNFRVSFIAVDPSFTQLKVDYFYRNSLTTVNTGLGVRTYSGSVAFSGSIGPVDITHKISIIPLLIGIQATSVNGQHCVYWDTKLKDANSIDYNLTADRTTRITFFASYILIADKTSASSTLQIFIDQLYIGGVDNVPTYQNPVYYNLTNLHAGINSYRFQLLGFNFDKTSFLLTTVGYYKFLNISIWSYRKRSCSVANPYYELKTNLCYDTCPTGYVNTNGNLQKYCKDCSSFIAACQQCSSSGSTCYTCFGNYALSGGTCSCPTGFYVSTAYENYVDKCRPCDASCVTCNGPNNNQCLSCIAGKTLSSGQCVCPYGTSPSGACKSSCRDQGCQTCSSPTLCQTCKTGFILSGARCICDSYKYYDKSTVSCLSCHSTCKVCSGPSNNQCLACDSTTDFRYLDSGTNRCLCLPGYNQQSNVCTASPSTSCNAPGYAIDPETSQCKQLCGDGVIINYQCDDGNTNDGDGCSSNCVVQPDFMCSNNPISINKRSFCSYTKPIAIILNSTLKDIYSNKLYMNYTFQPNIGYALSIYTDLKENIKFTPSEYQINVQKAFFNLTSSFLQVQVDYGANLQDQNITITFTPPNTSLTYSVPVSESIVLVSSTNKLSASFHDETKYSLIKICKIIGMICYIGGLISAIVVSFFRKMIGLQYITMLQFVYFSIMLSKLSHPCYGPLQEWDYINGYNKIRVNISDAKIVNNDFWIFQYFDYFYINFNAMLFACLANYGITLVLYILSVVSDRSISRKLKNSAIFFGVQLGFALIMFSLSNIAISLFLEAKAGHIFIFTYGVNKFFLIITILLVIGQCIFYVLKIHELNDSLYYYHRHKNYTHFYPIIFLARNLVIIICIALASQFPTVAPYITLGVQLGYIIATFAGRAFKRIIDYIRFSVVQLTLTLILISHLIQTNFVENYSQMDAGLASFFQGTAICVYVGMLIGLLLTLGSFGFHFWKSKTQDIHVNPDEKGDQQGGPEDGLYIPPMGYSKQYNISKQLTTNPSKQLSKQKQKLSSENSKQILVFDIQQQGEQQTGQPNSEQFINSLYDQGSKRKLRSRKFKQKDDRQYY